jgi:hypothetical protein
MSVFCTSRKFPETIGKAGFKVPGTLRESMFSMGICFTSSSKNTYVKPYDDDDDDDDDDDAENNIFKFTVFWDVSPFGLV